LTTAPQHERQLECTERDAATDLVAILDEAALERDPIRRRFDAEKLAFLDDEVHGKVGHLLADDLERRCRRGPGVVHDGDRHGARVIAEHDLARPCGFEVAAHGRARGDVSTWARPTFASVNGATLPAWRSSPAMLASPVIRALNVAGP